MKSLVFAFFLLVAASYCALSEAMILQCPLPCSKELKPVCGTWTRHGKTSTCTFSSPCVLNNQNCQWNQDWRLHRLEPCKRNTSDCRKLLRPIRN